MTKHLSNKTIVLLVILTIIGSVTAITWMLLHPNVYSNNCWDKYQTEQEAIMHCEGEN